MCLQKIIKKAENGKYLDDEFKKDYGVMEGYKVIRKNNGRWRPFWFNFNTLTVGKWIKDKRKYEIGVRRPPHLNQSDFRYPTGFHVYLHRHNAVTAYRHWLTRDDVSLFKVKFRKIVAVGEEYCGCNVEAMVVVAKEIKLIKEVF